MVKSLDAERKISEKEKIHLAGLLECGDFDDAKKYAEGLMTRGVYSSDVNHIGYEIVNRLRFINKKFVRGLTQTFKDYCWTNWLR